jgi:hypothetical protein
LSANTGGRIIKTVFWSGRDCPATVLDCDPQRFLLSILEIAIFGQMVEKKNSDCVRERRILPVVLEPLKQVPDLERGVVRGFFP